MSTEKVQYLIEAVDKTDTAVASAKKNVDNLNAAILKTGDAHKKASAMQSIHEEHSQKLNKLTGDLVDNFIGVGAGIAVFTGLKNAVMDAGLKTDAMNEALGKISATVGTQVLPYVQEMVDYLTQNADAIARTFSGILNIVKSTFLTATSVIYQGASLVMSAISKLPGTNKQYWSQIAIEMKNNAQQAMQEANWSEVFDFSKIEIKTPVRKNDKNSASAKKVTDTLLAAYNDAMSNLTTESDQEKRNNATITARADRDQKIIELEKALKETRINQISDGFKRELAILDNKHAQELELYGNNARAKAAIDQRYAIEKAAIEDKMLKDSQQRAALEVANKQTAYGMIASSASEMLGAISQASKKNATAQKAIAIIQSIINTALAASKANSATPYPPVNAALMAVAIAQGAVQTGIIAAQKFASGGFMPGIENGRTDSKVAMVSPGELMVNKRQQANLMDLLNNAGSKAQSTVFHIYDQTGDLIKTIVGKARAGEADELVNVLKNRQLAIG